MKKRCLECGKEFKVKPSTFNNRKYCSKTCMAKGYSKRLKGKNNPHWKGLVDIVCRKCGKKFAVIQARKETAKYCSRICKDSVFKVKNKCSFCGKIFITSGSEKRKYCSSKCLFDSFPKNKCKKCGVVIKKGLSFCKKCTKWGNQKIIKVCVFCGKKLVRYKIQKNKIYFCKTCIKKVYIGKLNPNWKGGIRDKNKAIRASDEYKKWRLQVFKRDKYICQKCNKVGGELHAHHIKKFSEYPELRVVVENGITLCKKCHNLISKR